MQEVEHRAGDGCGGSVRACEGLEFLLMKLKGWRGGHLQL